MTSAARRFRRGHLPGCASFSPAFAPMSVRLPPPGPIVVEHGVGTRTTNDGDCHAPRGDLLGEHGLPIRLLWHRVAAREGHDSCDAKRQLFKLDTRRDGRAPNSRSSGPGASAPVVAAEAVGDRVLSMGHTDLTLRDASVSHGGNRRARTAAASSNAGGSLTTWWTPASRIPTRPGTGGAGGGSAHRRDERRGTVHVVRSVISGNAAVAGAAAAGSSAVGAGSATPPATPLVGSTIIRQHLRVGSQGQPIAAACGRTPPQASTSSTRVGALARPGARSTRQHHAYTWAGLRPSERTESRAIVTHVTPPSQSTTAERGEEQTTLGADGVYFHGVSSA
jgi:hypothetical protein